MIYEIYLDTTNNVVNVVLIQKDREGFTLVTLNLSGSAKVRALNDVKDWLNKRYGYPMEIKDVVFSDPITTVYWKDGTETRVTCQDGDTFDREKGLAMAISKKALGNTADYYKEFKQAFLKDDFQKCVDLITAPMVSGEVMKLVIDTLKRTNKEDK